MKTTLSTFVNNRINEAKFFGASWVSTGRKQVSSELLDEYCQQIEIAATKEAIISFYESNKAGLNLTFYEVSDDITVEALANFVINEFANQFSFNDGGNISYSLTARF